MKDNFEGLVVAFDTVRLSSDNCPKRETSLHFPEYGEPE